MEAVSSSKILVPTYQTPTLRHISEEHLRNFMLLSKHESNITNDYVIITQFPESV
jgi:hypothetical protein